MMQRFALDNAATNNAKLLDDLGISQDGDNSLLDFPVVQSQESIFHESLLRSMEELLASEAALEAESLNTTLGRGFPGSFHSAFPLSSEQPGPLNSGASLSGASLTSSLPIETLEMLAASHLQLLAQQQARISHSNPSNPGSQDSFNLLQHAQPAGLTNDGAMMFVTPHSQVGMPGWVGHRVVALPGSNNINPMRRDLDSGSSLASLAASQSSFHRLSVRSEDAVARQVHSAQRLGPSSSWDHLGASGLSSLQGLQTMPLSSSSHQRTPSGNGNAARPMSSEQLDFSNFQNLPTFARRGRGRASGPKSMRSRAPQVMHSPLLDSPRMAPGAAPMRSAAPSWAGADWDPRGNAQNRARAAGTGVFLPSGTGVFLPVSEEGTAAPQQHQQQQAAKELPRDTRVQGASSAAAAAAAAAAVAAAAASAAAKASAPPSDCFDDLPASLMP